MLATISNDLKGYKSKNRHRFNGLRELILERDGYKCTSCGMSQIEHIARWNKSLTINHIDGNGRNSDCPNNDPINLETLCLHCHGLADCTNAKWQLHYGIYPKESRTQKLRHSCPPTVPGFMRSTR